MRQTYAELDEVVNRAANALAARGVVKGDRIAILSHNHHAYVVLVFATARLGAILVPINFMLKADEVAYILAHSGATGMIAEDALAALAQAAIEQSGDAPRFGVRGAIEEQGCALPPGWEAVQSWFAHADASRPDIAVDDEDPLQLMYTSGTESRPTGVTMLSSRNRCSPSTLSCVVDCESMSGRRTSTCTHCRSTTAPNCIDCFLGPGPVWSGRPASSCPPRTQAADAGDAVEAAPV